MKTPIVDFVQNYSEENQLRLHMPGHKGKNFLGFEKWDITEIDGADVLYASQDIIAQSQNNASHLFGTEKTLFSTEGSSLAIRAMLCLLKMYDEQQGRGTLIAAARNVHKTFVTACVLLDLQVDWLMPENQENIISCNITPEYLESYLKNACQKPTAIYITSPDYLGNIQDIRGLSAVCKKYGVFLITDNAHGAYLNFLPESLHPISLGADMCCDSAHKTLPVLTGGAYLHISKNTVPFFSQNAESAMSMFASTSPSYLILQSLDTANRYLSENYPQELISFTEKVKALKQNLTEHGFKLYGKEPLKITIATKSYGYYGYEFAQLLYDKKVVCEFYDSDFVVMMLTPQISSDEIKKLQTAIESIPQKKSIINQPPPTTKKERILSVRQAYFSKKEILPIEFCEGRISAEISVTCPPAIPIVICGEKIDRNTIESFKYYGKETCCVVAEL